MGKTIEKLMKELERIEDIKRLRSLTSQEEGLEYQLKELRKEKNQLLKKLNHD